MSVTRQPGAAAPDMANGLQVLQPGGWPQPKGYANGMMADGRFVVTGGVVGWDVSGRFGDGFVAQVRQALENVVAILAEGGARPDHLGSSDLVCRGHGRIRLQSQGARQKPIAR
ncbi:enamine deaminase RidA (YjgF/YER057c/UK114 family) [Bradyrhizobium diazoefficiens]